MVRWAAQLRGRGAEAGASVCEMGCIVRRKREYRGLSFPLVRYGLHIRSSSSPLTESWRT